MSSQPQILIQKLNYITPDNQAILNDLTLSFGLKKTAIVGRNGVGKSTLLKLIVGELQPASGAITMSGRVAYCPQQFSLSLNQTIAKVFGVANKLAALDKIRSGSDQLHDYEMLDDDWTVEQRMRSSLESFGFRHVALDRDLKTMSGGEVTRVYLASVFFQNADFIILDEPTNNLDVRSKQLLYQVIQQWKKGLIVVSHDRTLLRLMDNMIELTTMGAHSYGGNYDDYVEQKALEQTALLRQVNDAQKQQKKTKEILQKTREKREQRESRGKQMRASGSQSKLILDSMKERSGKTQNKLSIKEERLLATTNQQLQEAKKKIEITNTIHIGLPETYVPSNKMIVEFDSVTFSYEQQNNPVIQNFNLIISGPERLALVGENGSGKTTLIKLLLGEITPDMGSIKIGTSRVNYLDQNVNILDVNLSILDNYKALNADVKEEEARSNLAAFLFRSHEALKLVSDLSGGEKLRVALACVLTSNEPPQLLILDEPTNHLDLDSLAALESVLNCYEGALVIISHDKDFMDNIGITKQVDFDNFHWGKT